MPSLVRYERKRLTEAQYHALGVYITRKRQREEAKENGTNDVDNKQSSSACNNEIEEDIPKSPPKPTAREIREQKQRELNDIRRQLTELEALLSKLKEQKHELFEEVKSSLVHSKKHEEKERQMQGFPSPFVHHPGMNPGPPMMNVSPFRPGMKRSRSPSPPLVQLYSPFNPTSNMQTLPHMGTNRLPAGPPENLNPGYQFQQNYPPRDAHQQVQGPQVAPQSHSPCPPGNQLPPHDRIFPPFGSPQVLGPQNPSRPPPPPAGQPPFITPKKRDSYGQGRSRYH